MKPRSGWVAAAHTKEALKVFIIMLMRVDDHKLLIWQYGLIYTPSMKMSTAFKALICKKDCPQHMRQAED